MPNRPSTTLLRALVVLAGLLIVKITVAVMLGYSNYFPPNFQSDFLQGRDGYFFGVPVGVLSAHRVRSCGAVLGDAADQRAISNSISDVASTPGSGSCLERAVCRVTERPVDGLRHLDWNDCGDQFCNLGGRYGNVLGSRLASGREAAICNSPLLDDTQLSAALLSRGAQDVRRIGDRTGGPLSVVRSARVLGKLACAADPVGTEPPEAVANRPSLNRQ